MVSTLRTTRSRASDRREAAPKDARAHDVGIYVFAISATEAAIRSSLDHFIEELDIRGVYRRDERPGHNVLIKQLALLREFVPAIRGSRSSLHRGTNRQWTHSSCSSPSPPPKRYPLSDRSRFSVPPTLNLRLRRSSTSAPTRSLSHRILLFSAARSLFWTSRCADVVARCMSRRRPSVMGLGAIIPGDTVDICAHTSIRRSTRRERQCDGSQ